MPFKKTSQTPMRFWDIIPCILNLGTQIQDPLHINSTNEAKMVGACSKQGMRNARKFQAEIQMETDHWRDYGTEGNIRIDPIGFWSADWVQLVYTGAQWRVFVNTVGTFGFIKREFLDHMHAYCSPKRNVLNGVCFFITKL